MLSIFSYFFNKNNDNNNNKYKINKSILQGIHIRDKIEIKNVIQKVFIEDMNIDIIYYEWDMRNYDFDSQNEKEKDKINNFIFNKITELDFDKKIFIYFIIPNHANLLYIEKKRNIYTYYFYEPHMPKNNEEYQHINYITKIFNKLDFKKGIIPYTLKQDQLPLCYMYVLHNFIFLNHIKKRKSDLCKIDDDDSIIDFTNFIIEKCYEVKLINKEDYYLLTDKINQYNLYGIKRKINNIFLKTCNPNVLLYLLKKNMYIDYNDIKNINGYVDFYYINEFLILVRNNKEINEFNKHTIYIFMCVMKFYYNININYNLFDMFDNIDSNIILEILQKNKILNNHINYNLYYFIFNLIKNNENKITLAENLFNEINDNNVKYLLNNVISSKSIILKKESCIIRQRND